MLKPDHAPASAGLRLILGLGVMLLGLLLTLDNFGLVEGRRFIRFWPVLLVLLGFAKLSHGLRTGTRSGGSFLILFGTMLLLNNLGVLRLRQAFAVFLLGLGAVIAWRALRSPRPAVPDPGTASRELDVFALLGGIQRAVSGAEFRGGSATAVLGGCELDLTRAALADGQAVLNTFAFWGGIEVKVPPEWTVETRVAAVLGGVSDTTRRPDQPGQRLILTGYALMGGIEVHN